MNSPLALATRPLVVGIEWLVDADGCDANTLRDLPRLQLLVRRIADELALHVLGQLWHPFPGEGGVTGMLLLSESHLTCHTYPEHGVATINLASCRPRPDYPWHQLLTHELSASRVTIRRFDRGEAMD